ncbi:MAG: putative toxin-antitoxin system toxin component, PIN family [Verrucomicrobiales bacterium]|nr:putative toxin-antitoxin system toxin component, PIN family [Verrucomicrobiales bacterium]
MVVVLDTASFVSGILWRTETHQVLQSFANGRIVLAVTQSILREYARVALAVRKEERLPVDPQPWLNAVAEMAFEFEPVPFREPVCRDANDDQFIACALAAHADVIVTRDNDLSLQRNWAEQEKTEGTESEGLCAAQVRQYAHPVGAFCLQSDSCTTSYFSVFSVTSCSNQQPCLGLLSLGKPFGIPHPDFRQFLSPSK